MRSSDHSPSIRSHSKGSLTIQHLYSSAENAHRRSTLWSPLFSGPPFPMILLEPAPERPTSSNSPAPPTALAISSCAGVASYGIEKYLLQLQPPIFSAFLAPPRSFRLTIARRVSDAAATSVRLRAHRCGMRCRLSARHTSDGETDCFHARRDVRRPGTPGPAERPKPQNGPQAGRSIRSACPQEQGGWS